MIEPSPVSSPSSSSSTASSSTSSPSSSSSSPLPFPSIESLSSSVSPLSEIDEVQVLKELTISLKDVKASATTTLKKLKSCTLSEINLFRELVTLRDDVHIPELHGSQSVSLSNLKSSLVSISVVNDVLVSTKSNNENIGNNIENVVEVKTVKKRKSKKVTVIEGTVEVAVAVDVEVIETILNKIEIEDRNEEKKIAIEVEKKVENVFLFPEIAFENSKNSLKIKSEIDFNIPVVDSSYFIYTGEKADAEKILEEMSLSFLKTLKLIRRQYHKIHRKINYD